MATVKFERVVSYSSEDPKYPAENLLKFGSKWKCKNPGEPNATVILQLDQPRTIETIDIGNEHSAFIHVLVGRAASDEYESLLPASSFMSPVESDQSTNTNRVRMFTKLDFLKPAADEKWDRVKIVCTQPFNKRVQYGLSFIVVKRPEDKSEPTCFGLFKLKDEREDEKKCVQPSISLGRFHLKKDDRDEDEVAVGSFFAKRRELTKDVVSSANGTALPLDSPGSNTLKATLTLAQQKAVAKKVVKRGKDSSVERDDVPLSPKITPQPKLSPTVAPKIKGNASQNQREEWSKHQNPYSTAVKTPGKHGKANTTLPVKPLPPSDKSKRPYGDKKTPIPTKKGKLSSQKRKPFSRLLEGVTLVISGYVNPTRSIIRSKALDMGAKYKQDWDSSCTHLICAFQNTPKFKQVKGKGKIVQKDWIEKCHEKRARLPWRRFALDINDFKQPESEDEIVEEVPEPSTSRNDESPEDLNLEMDSTSGCKAESGSDTEDEIERLQTKKKATTNALSYNPYLSDTDVDSDEELRPDTSQLPMPPLPT